MSNEDKFLQEYFVDLGVALGFSKDHALSLFDLPSILSSSFDPEMNFNRRMTRDVFIYSQCQAETIITSSFFKCYNDVAPWKPTWLNYYYNKRNVSYHPCYEKDGKCCNQWTTQLQHELKPIMKVCAITL